MEEQLISFETAKLAGDKGFQSNTTNIYDWVQGYEMVSQSLLQKWLREVHKLSINIISKSEKLHFCVIVDYKNKKAMDVKGKKDYSFKSYEEALELGLQEALKLIK